MRRALAAAAVLALALVGCTDDGQSPTSTTSSPPPTGHTSTTPTSTTSDPSDEPPVLPDAAKAQTTAGAKAFVRHYADVLNYAWLNSIQALAQYLATRLARSAMLIRKVARDAAAKAANRLGGEWTVIEPSVFLASFNEPIVCCHDRIFPKAGRLEAESAPAKPIKDQTSRTNSSCMWDPGWELKDREGVMKRIVTCILIVAAFS